MFSVFRPVVILLSFFFFACSNTPTYIYVLLYDNIKRKIYLSMSRTISSFNRKLRRDPLNFFFNNVKH